jgi:hypothetical protein
MWFMEEDGNNKIYKSLISSAGLLFGLFFCHFIEISVAGYQLKKIDIISDIKADTIKFISKNPVVKKQFIDSCKNGLICFEDYSDDTTALNKIFNAFINVKQNKGKVRIGFFGDSFIEGDILCADVRDTLQALFGGTGVGYVPITSEVAQFRTTIFHSYNGFLSYSMVNCQSLNTPLGGCGYLFKAKENNFVKYSANTQLRHLNKFKNIKLFYTAKENTEIKYTLNNLYNSKNLLVASNKMQQLLINNANATSVKFQFPASDKLNLYGISIEDSIGVCVDNFGLRGNSGLGLLKINDNMHRQFDSLQNYNLIILQYGLNVISPTTKDVSWYSDAMVKVINGMKKNYPNASFLLISISDRSTKINGQYQTMQTIPMMVEAQREIAKRSKIAFWDLYSAMGGENSMITLVDNTPPLANKDYTHLNSIGGKKIANIFVETLLYDLGKYNEKKNYTAINDSNLLIRK